MDGGNNYIYVSKWLLNHREENGRDAITEAEQRRNGFDAFCDKIREML